MVLQYYSMLKRLGLEVSCFQGLESQGRLGVEGLSGLSLKNGVNASDGLNETPGHQSFSSLWHERDIVVALIVKLAVAGINIRRIT